MRGALLAATLAAAGCGAIFNGATSTVNGPLGTTVDGMPVPTVVSNHFGHEVKLPTGQTCYIRTQVSAGYVILDILSITLIPLLVDALTNDWYTLDSVGCPVSVY